MFIVIILVVFFIFYCIYFINKRKARNIKCGALKSKETYSDLLQKDEWRQKRLVILNRDRFKCRYCGCTQNLQVHHKYYLQYPNHQKVKPWNYPDDALITLCDKCHLKVHQTKQIKVYYKKYDSC